MSSRRSWSLRYIAELALPFYKEASAHVISVDFRIVHRLFSKGLP
jgi:hypothetical protein